MSLIGCVKKKVVGKMCIIKLFLDYPSPQKGGKSLEKPGRAGGPVFAYTNVRNVKSQILML